MMTTDTIQKDIIAKSFNKGRATYNSNALVQKEIVNVFCDLLYKQNINHAENILEIGCGTGFLTEKILSQNTPENFYINDLDESAMFHISEIMKNHANKQYKFILGDAENIRFPKNLDMIVSTSTFQWFSDFPEFIKKPAQLLKRDGVFAFSTFGPENFREIKVTANTGLHYYSLDEIKEMLTADFNIIQTMEYKRQLWFHNPIEVFQHIKKNGTNGLSSTIKNPAEMRNIMSRYSLLFTGENSMVQLTYHPVILIAQKKKIPENCR